MPKYDYDLVTIGAGSGGGRASRGSGGGGPGVMRGCVPKKLLVLGSHFAEDFEDAKGFGWQPGEAVFDWASLIRAKNKELDRLESVYHRILRESGAAEIEGTARLADPHTVEGEGKRLTAPNTPLAP